MSDFKSRACNLKPQALGLRLFASLLNVQEVSPGKVGHADAPNVTGTCAVTRLPGIKISN
jgi:hypothetical protein